MTTRVVDIIPASGLHSARPSTGPDGSLYSCTTHSLVYRYTTALGWVTWATLGASGAVLLSTVTTAGDLIVGTGSGTVARKGLGSALQVLRVNAAGTDLEYATPSGGSITRASLKGDGAGDHSTSSTSYVDTVYTLTIAATAGQHLICTFTGCIYIGSGSSVSCLVFFALNIGGTDRIANAGTPSNNSYVTPISVMDDYTVASGDISGGLVTVKVRWKTNASTASLANQAGNLVPHLSVLNVG